MVTTVFWMLFFGTEYDLHHQYGYRDVWILQPTKTLLLEPSYLSVCQLFSQCLSSIPRIAEFLGTARIPNSSKTSRIKCHNDAGSIYR